MSARPLVCAISLLLAGCAPSALERLVVDGPTLHASLVTCRLEEVTTVHRSPALRTNPEYSTSFDFVETIARGSSQGQLSGAGVRAAAYGVYLGESEVGFYGLEAKSAAAADALEPRLREIWSFNGEQDLARVHRHGNVLVVVWHRGVSASCWRAVNSGLVGRLQGGSS